MPISLDSIDNLEVGNLVYFHHDVDGRAWKGIITAPISEEKKDCADWEVKWLFDTDGNRSEHDCVHWSWELVKAKDQGKPWSRLDTWIANGGMLKKGTQ
tara:strand:- start:406 stop:702 length:297 start_codon:yes stop_codon:yes gene_type:complete